MAFNWFRRQFNPSEDPSETAIEQTEAVGELDPNAVAPQSATASESDPVQEDYLAWAKAAYQNIQEQQQSTAARPTVETENVNTADRVEAEPPEAAVEPEPETISAIEEIALSPIVEAELPPEAAVSSTPAQELTTPEVVEPTPTEALPAWARADADRQARLERLKATAIDVEKVLATPALTVPPAPISSAPAPVYQPEPSSTQDAPDQDAAIAFDDGFLWSAEVLASQGRRPEDISADEISWLQKLRQGLGKTRRGFVNQLKSIVGQGPLNQDAVIEIEALLLMADVGVEATDAIIAALQAKMRDETLPPDAAIAYLKKILRDILDAPIQSNYSPVFAPQKDTLNIWLMTGINGAGKTTTIGKIAHVATESGFSCLIAAADTFRAAAVQQVKVWGERSSVEVIANPGQNTDPAAVVFDAIAAAQSRHTELLLVDTAGRLQNKKNLMDELRKVRQIIDKKAPHAKIESLLVLDATLGQNGLRQAQVFSEAAQLSGVVLTKLDGTAKGGVALAVVQQLGLPIRFIGAGEGIKDLRPFSSYEFVEALLSN
jgi:fused signal recognition particle receptor